MGEDAVKPVKLKWHLFERHDRATFNNEHDGSHATLGKYRLHAIQYAESKWKAIVWLGCDTVGFRNEQPSETAAQRTAESLTRELLKREARRLGTLQRKIGC